MWRCVFDIGTGRGKRCNDYGPLNPGEFAENIPSSQCGFFDVTPERYMWNSTGLSEWPQWGEEVAAKDLASAKAKKIEDIEAAYLMADGTPVSVGGVVYSGGRESAESLKGYYDFVVDYLRLSDPTIETIQFYDLAKGINTYPILSDTEVDAMDVVGTVSYFVVFNKFKKAQYLNQIASASTVAEVESITWGQ